ncbi:PEP-CTERM sorting domain-containing protein [Anabaena subtropica]|uniref:PEP-CTERM sorting domain-containing protein n=1 Tax=Anabaena subtropica FACHB-260 TaxID=2692884 RepID=A0ABR8CUH8_9NOST|nr:PEP-CTERM sorting domain-containing protein [Anabaena subtropica]MBD2346624.1 PEP-CTERM sorting domain-containing protein [Anabaena subtropica FACHB-260]
MNWYYFAYDFGSSSVGFGDLAYTLKTTPNPVPEPTTAMSLVTLGAWGVTSRLKRRVKAIDNLST